MRNSQFTWHEVFTGCYNIHVLVRFCFYCILLSLLLLLLLLLFYFALYLQAITVKKVPQPPTHVMLAHTPTRPGSLFAQTVRLVSSVLILLYNQNPVRQVSRLLIQLCITSVYGLRDQQTHM